MMVRIPESNKSKRPIAVLFIGNAGAGKSTLLSQIGGNFKSGAKFRRGFTQDVSEVTVLLDGGGEVTLIDVPGLFEPDPKYSELNAKKLTEALNKPYDFKIFFVLKANNTGTEDADLDMMAKVDECVRKSDGSKLIYRVFINQILEDRVLELYKENVINDDFKGFFSEQKKKGREIDVDIDRIIPLRFYSNIKENVLRGVITDEIKSHKEVSLSPNTHIDICIPKEEAPTLDPERKNRLRQYGTYISETFFSVYHQLPTISIFSSNQESIPIESDDFKDFELINNVKQHVDYPKQQIEGLPLSVPFWKNKKK